MRFLVTISLKLRYNILSDIEYLFQAGSKVPEVRELPATGRGPQRQNPPSFYRHHECNNMAFPSNQDDDYQSGFIHLCLLDYG